MLFQFLKNFGQTSIPGHTPTINFAPAKRLLAVATLVVLTACGVADPYAAGFERISIGDSRNRAIEVLGNPTSINSIEVPLAKVEQLTWRAHMNGHVYIIHTVWDRVATKSVIQ